VSGGSPNRTPLISYDGHECDRAQKAPAIRTR
jgi:hypothetical protein